MYLRPSVLCVFGAKNSLSTHEERGKKIEGRRSSARGLELAAVEMLRRVWSRDTSYEASDALLIFEQLVETVRAAIDWNSKMVS